MMSSSNKTLKTPFMWPGSKDKYYNTVTFTLPSIERYFEPFVGGGSIYFKLLAQRGIIESYLSDINSDLIVTYESIRDNVNQIKNKLPKVKDRAIWEEMKSSSPNDKVERAVRFIYLNRNSFFGLGGWMNADRYCYDRVIERITFFSPLMQKTTFSAQGCFSLPSIKTNDFVFVDPPYVGSNNTACYGIDDGMTFTLNKNYATYVSESDANFYFITKWNEEISDIFKKNDIVVQKHEWEFRKPTKEVQKDYELHSFRKKDTLFRF